MKLHKKKIKSLSAKQEIGNDLTPNIGGARGSNSCYVDHTNGMVCQQYSFAFPCLKDENESTISVL